MMNRKNYLIDVLESVDMPQGWLTGVQTRWSISPDWYGRVDGYYALHFTNAQRCWICLYDPEKRLSPEQAQEYIRGTCDYVHREIDDRSH